MNAYGQRILQIFRLQASGWLLQQIGCINTLFNWKMGQKRIKNGVYRVFYLEFSVFVEKLGKSTVTLMIDMSLQ